ncbi:NADPH-dependent FMN reductase [Penicillium mononematosum]|uniref:NADPH-dependent FMN reductase n=1 Tax=Penicillium mononematosum TaxID=268346 RepID=UPI0025498D3C|nr:NADPH-dependent FMN reductase [Penicillium mononematosum]KAJ6190676.1 NADPH-dependent FMN reductase [Penicillium mononematosum]
MNNPSPTSPETIDTDPRHYNWSIPASLTNALDYLLPKRKGKSAGIVSCGSRGDGKAADNHLRGTLTGLRMRVVKTAPGLPVRYTGLPVGALWEEEVKVELDGILVNNRDSDPRDLTTAQHVGIVRRKLVGVD